MPKHEESETTAEANAAGATGDETEGGVRPSGAEGEGAVPGETYAEEISLADFESLQAKAAKADEHWNQFLRVSADFDNFKKRAARDRLEAIKYANEALLEKLIPVLDNFEMALLAAQDAQTGNAEALKTGVSMILSQLKGVMTDSGLEEIDASGKMFDPNFHEGVSQQESADVPEGQVLQQLRRGYKLRERLVRPATVIVAKSPIR